MTVEKEHAARKPALAWNAIETWFHACVAATLVILAAFNVPFFTIDHSGIGLLPVITTLEYGSASIVPVYVLAAASSSMAVFTNPWRPLRLALPLTLAGGGGGGGGGGDGGSGGDGGNGGDGGGSNGGGDGEDGGQNRPTFHFKHLGALALIVIDLYTLSVLFHNPVLLVIAPGSTAYATINTLHAGAVVLVVLASATGIHALWTVLARARAREVAIALAVIALASFVSTYIHEAGHAIFVLLSGGRITYFSALPTHGEVRWSGVPATWHPVVQLGGVILSNVYLLAYLLARRQLVAVRKRHPRVAYLDYLLLAVALLAWLDFPLYVLNTLAGIPHWFVLGGSFGDIALFLGMTGTPPWLLAIVAAAELAAGVFLSWRGARRRFVAFFTLDDRAGVPGSG